MADAWGYSWGSSWGDSWGSISVVQQAAGGVGSGFSRGSLSRAWRRYAEQQEARERRGEPLPVPRGQVGKPPVAARIVEVRDNYSEGLGGPIGFALDATRALAAALSMVPLLPRYVMTDEDIAAILLLS